MQIVTQSATALAQIQAILDDVYVPRQAVKRRYDYTEMGLWRLENARKDELGWPDRYDFGGRFFYKLSELLAWEESRKTRAIQEITSPKTKNGKKVGRPRKEKVAA